MKICDINPFIRAAMMGEFSPANDSVISCDNRLFYILSGECEIHIDEGDCLLKENALIILPCGTEYSFKNAKNIKMIAINFDYTQKSNNISESMLPVPAESFDTEMLTDSQAFEDCDGFNQALVLEDMQYAKKQLLKITEIFNTVRLFKNEFSSSILKSVLTEIASAFSYSQNKALAQIDSVLEYLKEHFDTEISNEDLGKLTGYHPYHINRLVLKHTGLTLRQHLIGIRLENAKILLAQTDMPLYEISEKCGFNNSAYFSNNFKSKLGLSPGEYRKKYKKLI